MLFDDEEQLEVRHVISLAHHDISIYAGGEPIPEGELYIKKNAIRLARKLDGLDIPPDSQLSKPFYLFSESCSAKEDFYFALLRNQELALGTDKKVPEPLQFDVQDIISLVGKLHATEEQVHTRWLNALIGRVFLAVYKTKDLENFIREKLTKKISRVKRPSFLSHIVIRHVHPGTAAPYIFNPRLKELNVDGECIVEADIKYTGNFRIEVATTARIDLGARFKVREVDLVLSVVLRKIEGHGFIKLKPPPSNRFWFAFQTMPKMEMSIEPIVSSRQITYTMIIRQIENRIKEVVAETIVLPFWDDTPFLNTENKQWRGGIWAGDNEEAEEPAPEVITAPEPSEEAKQPEPLDLSDQKDSPQLEKSFTDPVATKSPTASIFGRKTSTKAHSERGVKAISTSVDSGPRGSWPASARSSPNVAIVPDSAKGEPVLGKTKETLSSPAIATLSAVAGSPPKPSSPLASIGPSLATESSKGTLVEHSTGDAIGDDGMPSDAAASAPAGSTNRRLTTSSTESVDSSVSTTGKPASLRSQTGSISRGLFRQDTGSTTSTATTSSNGGALKNNTLAAVSNAAIQAKQWGLHALQRNRDKRNEQGRPQPGSDRAHGVDLSQPMGRGRPLPPPGTPLPFPDKASKTTKITPKRKPLPPPLLPKRQADSGLGGGEGSAEGSSGGTDSSGAEEGSSGSDRQKEGGEVIKRPVPPPPLPKRPRPEGEENVFVVAAPSESEPTSPRESVSKSSGGPETKSEGDIGSGQASSSTESAGASRENLGASQASAVKEGEENEEKSQGLPGPTVTGEEEEDDGYGGWMDDGMFEEDGFETGPGDGAVTAREAQG